jgi:hypothetical protein
MQHVVPADTVNKHELLTLFKSATGKDVEIIPSQPSPYIDRTLGTENLELNNRLWRAAGYSKPPMIAEMVVARNLETTGYEIIKSIHPHPTMSEAIMEASAAAYNEVIHI